MTTTVVAAAALALLAAGYVLGRWRPAPRLLDEAERAREDTAVPADLADVAEFRIWCALERPLTEEEVHEHIKILRYAQLLSVEAIEIAHGTYMAAKKRVTALHQPVQHMGQTWCGECSVRRRTGPKADEWVAFIPHPCPTLDALDDKEA
jgi:hypothetical protein